MSWFYFSLVLLIGYPVLDLLTLYFGSSVSPAKGIALLYLIIWYFGAGRSQAIYAKEKFGRSYGRRSWGKPLLVGLVALFIYVLLSAALGAVVGTSAGISAAKRQVANEAATLHAPPGLLGAKWLMSQTDVMRIRPNTLSSEPDVLSESSVVFGRDAEVKYHFQNDLLVLILVTFRPPSDRPSFAKTQQNLNADYGGMPEPAPSRDHVLSSAKTVGRFTIQHSLADNNRTFVEQLILYRTEKRS